MTVHEILVLIPNENIEDSDEYVHLHIRDLLLLTTPKWGDV